MTPSRDRVRILHLIESSEPGGAESVLVSLAAGLDPERYESLAAMLTRDWLDRELEKRGIPVHVLENRWPYDPVFLGRLVQLVRRRQVGLIHAHEFMMAVYGSVAARLAGVPVVVTQHGKLYFPDKARRRRMYRLAVRLADVTVAVSEDLRRFMVQTIRPARPEKIITLYNGIDTDRYGAPVSRETVRREVGIPADAVMVVSVGAIKPLKGLDYLVAAAARVAETHPEVHVVLVGGGESEAALAAQAEELGIRKKVSLLGFRDDIPRLLAAADIYVCSSLSEGLSLAILEAMASGLPVIATDVGGNPELVAEGENGFLVPARDPVALADRLRLLLADPDRRRAMGAQGRRKAVESFSLPTMIQRYQQLYERVLDDRR